MRVFISHSSEDKKFVRTLKDDLEANGIKTWLDEDELQYGDSLIEKLQNALEDSSHFIIVLTQTSVNSDWIKLELNKAKLLKTQELLKKIIPIKYRECIIPDDLSNLLYAELTSEVVINDHDKVKFISDGYPKFISKLIKTLRSTERLLTEKDKGLIKAGNVINTDKEVIISPTVNVSDLKKMTVVKFYLKVIQYNNIQTLDSWRKKIKEESNISKINSEPLSKIFPVILPSVLRLFKDNYKIGEDITFKVNGINKYKGHFAGFKTKSDTYTIAIPGIIRKHLSIESNYIYLFEFNLQTHEINIIG